MFSLESQHEEPDSHPANVSCCNLRYTKTKVGIQLRDTKGKDGQDKTIKAQSTVILKAILHKEGIGKE